MDRLPVIFIYMKSLLELSAHRQGFLQSQATSDVFYGLLESWKHLSRSNQQEAFKYTEWPTTNRGEKPLSIFVRSKSQSIYFICNDIMLSGSFVVILTTSFLPNIVLGYYWFLTLEINDIHSIFLAC